LEIGEKTREESKGGAHMPSSVHKKKDRRKRQSRIKEYEGDTEEKEESQGTLVRAKEDTQNPGEIDTDTGMDRV